MGCILQSACASSSFPQERIGRLQALEMDCRLAEYRCFRCTDPWFERLRFRVTEHAPPGRSVDRVRSRAEFFLAPQEWRYMSLHSRGPVNYAIVQPSRSGANVAAC